MEAKNLLYDNYVLNIEFSLAFDTETEALWTKDWALGHKALARSCVIDCPTRLLRDSNREVSPWQTFGNVWGLRSHFDGRSMLSRIWLMSRKKVFGLIRYFVLFLVWVTVQSYAVFNVIGNGKQTDNAFVIGEKQQVTSRSQTLLFFLLPLNSSSPLNWTNASLFSVRLWFHTLSC